MEDSVRRRLAIQNEVLNWLEDLSEKLQKRADATTAEVLGLLDQTGVVERDLKNTFNSFRNLSYHRFIENKISEEETVGSMNEDKNNSVEAGIPAQSYEADILPRYKEALSLAMSSYKRHLQKTNTAKPAGSVFKIGSAHGPLPHIIGSEEYIHDNGCGLAIDTDDFISGAAHLDFSHGVEPNAFCSSAGDSSSHAMFSADLYGREKGPSEKDGVEPFVSAALDFKAMLEAALLSPYKFYDEDNSSLPEVVSGYNNNLAHQTSTTSSTAAIPKTQQQAHIEDPTTTVLDTASDMHAHELCSAILSESLFDTEEELLPSVENQSNSIPTTAEAAKSTNISESSSGLSIQESGEVSSNNEKEIEGKQVEVIVTSGEVITSNVNSLSSLNSCDRSECSKRPAAFDPSVCRVSEEGISSGSSSVTSHDLFNREISLDQAVQQSLPLPSNVLFDDFDSDSDNDLRKPVYAVGRQVIPNTQVLDINSETGDSNPTRECSFSSAGVLISEIEPESPTSSICSLSSSVIANIEGSSLARELTQNKMPKSIMNEMPGQEEPAFSMVVTISQEPGSLFSLSTESCFREFYALSTSSKGNASCGSSLYTKATESCDIAESTYRHLHASMVAGEPSVVRIRDDPVTADVVQEVSISGKPVDGGTSLDSGDSQRVQSPKSEKSCKLDSVSVVNDLFGAEDVQRSSTTQAEQHGTQDVPEDGTVSDYRSLALTDEMKDDTVFVNELPEGKSSLIESLLKLPVRHPSLFDSDEE